LTTASLAYSQVGVNTPNPQGAFHIDGAKDNPATGVPTATQQENDLIVNDLGRVGIGTNTPTTKLDVAGNVKIADGTQGANKILTSDANGVASWQSFAGAVPTSNGSVIAIDGQFLIAQEITVQMSADYSNTVGNVAEPIGNLDVEIIDNENRFSSTATTNSFTVVATGVYQIILNFLIEGSEGNPVIGIWDDTTNAWVARVNDYFTGGTNNISGSFPVQTYSLITSINMDSTHVYSFRIASSSNVLYTAKAMSSGSTGKGPISQVIVKRLR
jgi:hypothetical protein